MPLRLVLGPANAAKAGEVLGAFTAATPRGALLVVPTAADAAHYARELSAGGVLLGTVTTFPGLVAEVAARTNFAARRATPIQRERLLRRAIGRLSLDAFADSAGARGFPTAAGALISELQRALVTPQRFTAALRAWAGKDPRRAAHAEDLAAIYGSYSRELERSGLVDGELFAWRSLDALRARPGAWGTSPVFFYGFDDVTGLERDAIETLARVVGVDVAVSLTYEAGREALSARARVVEELRAFAASVEELPALDAHYADGARAALHHVERALFSYERDDLARPDPGDSVVLLEAGGERAEAEQIAGLVLSLVRDEGYAPGEIVVICRSIGSAGPLLERVFARFGIACTSERRPLFAGTSLGRGLLALARCALGDETVATPDELVRYLRTPGVAHGSEGPDGLELLIQRFGARTVPEARALYFPSVRELDALRAARDPAAVLLRHARHLLAVPRQGRAAILTPGEELDARAVVALAGAVEELGDLGERVRGRELLELLETLQLPLPAPAAADAVLISEPLGIRARRFRAVFVSGLCEGEFPRPPSPEPFLSDERRRELAIASGLALPAREDGLAAERYLFYASVSRATERLFLSYRSSDEEGRAVLGSPFLADVAELLAPSWFTRRRTRLLADVTWTMSDAPTDRERARAAAAAAGRAAAPEGPAVRQLGERALAHVRHTEIVSGGALESYADCPMKWLVERQLQPELMQPDGDPLTRGSFMHAVLERVFARLEGPLTPERLPEAERLLAGAMADTNDAGIGIGRPPALRRAMLTAIEADLRRYLRHEAAGGGRWEPRWLEQRFGFDGDPDSLPPLRLAEDVVLRGVIDRIDVETGGSEAGSGPSRPRAIVRDYKSMSQRPDQTAARWLSERQLQVALYMLAARELMELDPVGGFYQPLRGRELRARGLFRDDAVSDSRPPTPNLPGVYDNDGRPAEEFDELLDAVAADAIEITRRLRSGALEPCPQTCSRDGCLFPGICRSS